GKATGLGLISFAEALTELRPDLVVVLGDRFEILAAATAAMFANIPLAHISGGEITLGAFDDAIRHAVTKMASLHFPAAEPYRRRIIQMGERPEMVFTVGDPAVDVILHTPLLSRRELEASLGFPLARHNYLIAFHPPTRSSPAAAAAQFEMLLPELDARPESRLIFTLPNADCGGREIAARIQAFVASRPDKAAVFASLGYRRFLSLLSLVDALVGNSSSGIVEAPTFRTPSINIGDRQQGRLRSASVIDCAAEPTAIHRAFATLESDAYRRRLATAVNPYGDGGASERIVAILASCDLKRCYRKGFYDLPDEAGGSAVGEGGGNQGSGSGQ
ncbi:MAG: UDP-N-acetylglucosamine 2-epimerase, partial [Victivallales bacterium]|nr:UDP-N-acetylglucosamine 2-epimerase [Victivallales bacterium]